jgi:hypothetical protein
MIILIMEVIKGKAGIGWIWNNSGESRKNAGKMQEKRKH